MTRWQLIRISLLLLTIFAGGFVTGRLTAPSAPVHFVSLSGVMRSSDEVLARMVARFGLDPAQQRQFQPIIEETARRMAALPPDSPQRPDVFRACVRQLRPLLRPEQLPAFERAVENSLRLFRQRQETSPVKSN